MNKDKLAMRDAYGETLIELGSVNEDIVVLDADLSGSTRTAFFAKAFPNRFFNMGISEQDMVGTAAGLACVGKIPFLSSFAMFASGRAWEPIRNSVCYPNLNVKVVCSHAGSTVGEDGASHQALEDISIMRSIPNMRVLIPADYYETKQMIKFIANTSGPFYMRFSRSATPVVFSDQYQFNPNEYPVLRTGSDAAILANGIMLHSAILAANQLQQENISVTVVNVHSVKPVLTDQIARIAAETRAIVTAEEHNIIGGMGSAVAEALAKTVPTPIEFVGTQDCFGESGKPEDLLVKYHLMPEDIVKAVKTVLARKK